jgi:putative transposase
VAASEKHPEYRPVSITMFREHIRQLPPEDVGMGRGGKRMANAMTGPSPVDSRDVPATRAFERAAVDHSLLPMYVVLHPKGLDRIAVQPWVSALRCKFSGFILALWMSLLNPSAKTLAILYRRCIRTHERFPECIYSDNGSDLTSRFHTSFCAHVGADHSRIPVANPRFDDTIESLFCEMQTELLQTRKGNLALRASDRGVSKTHKAITLADHTPEQLWTALDMFTEWHNTRITKLNGESPSERLHKSLQRFTCSGIRLSLSNELMISTAVDIREFKVDPKDGIRINDRRYSCAALTLHRPARSKIQVRLDPENPHVVYAKINGAWHTCKSSGARMFETLDEIEKLAETTRLLEGTKYRKRVRVASQRDLVRIINEYDAARSAKAEAAKVDPPSQLTLLPPRTLFDQVRELEVEAPTEESEEVFDDVLGS